MKLNRQTDCAISKPELMADVSLMGKNPNHSKLLNQIKMGRELVPKRYTGCAKDSALIYEGELLEQDPFAMTATSSHLLS